MQNSVSFYKPVTPGSYLLLVESKAPWYAPSFLIKRAFVKAAPEYQSVKGLRRKAFTIGDNNGLFGGLYLWESLRDLDTYYDEERILSVEKKRGMRPILSKFQVLSSRDAETKTNPSPEKWQGSFTISIVDIPDLKESEALNLFNQTKLREGVITDYLTSKDNRLFQITLWRDEKTLKKHLPSSSVKVLKAPLILENL